MTRSGNLQIPTHLCRRPSVDATRNGPPVEPRNVYWPFTQIAADVGLRVVRLPAARHRRATLLTAADAAPRAYTPTLITTLRGKRSATWTGCSSAVCPLSERRLPSAGFELAAPASRSSIPAVSGGCRRLLRRPDRDAGVRPCQASLMSSVYVRNLLIRRIGQRSVRRTSHLLPRRLRLASMCVCVPSLPSDPQPRGHHNDLRAQQPRSARAPLGRLSYSHLHGFKAARSASRARPNPLACAPVSAPLQPGRRPCRAYGDQSPDVREGVCRGWGGRLRSFCGATLARASKIMAPASCLTGQVHYLPDAPEAYGAVITRAKAAPPQSCSAYLGSSLRLSCR